MAIKTSKPAYQPREYVFQGYDGLIYGAIQNWTPQEVGRINAQNRKDQTQGTWLPKSYLTEEELSKRAPETSLEGFKSACPTCGRSTLIKPSEVVQEWFDTYSFDIGPAEEQLLKELRELEVGQ